MSVDRRTFARRLFGIGAAAISVAPSGAGAALQPLHSPQCPRCLNVFGLIANESGVRVDGDCITYAPRADMRKRLPVKCSCGWSGTAVFCQ